MVDTRREPDAKAIWRRDLVQAAPRAKRRRDATLPAIIVVSLLIHATVIAALFLWPVPEVPAPAREIAVDLVPPPPPPPPPPKPPEQRAPPPKPAPKAPPKQAPPPQPPAAEKPRPQPPQKPAAPPAQKAPQKPPAPQKPQPPSASERLDDLLGPTPAGLGADPAEALGMPADVRAGEGLGGTDTATFSQLVLSRVGKAKKQGRYRGVPGRATVEFKLGDAGEVTSLAIIRPSGDPTLDGEAIDMVKRAEPFSPPPPGGRRDYVVTLVFKAEPAFAAPP